MAGRAGRLGHTDPPVRITTAATSRADDISMRQRRYVISMGIRTACFIAAVVVGPGWFRWVLIAGAVFLPYVAVVMANAVNTHDDGFALMDTSRERPELPSGEQPPETTQ